MELFCGNKGATDLDKNDAHRARTRHVREHQENGNREIKSMPIQDVVADCLIKALTAKKLNAKLISGGVRNCFLVYYIFSFIWKLLLFI